jgi:transcriptional regulator with GAF, ATPase, and Fis domain
LQGKLLRVLQEGEFERVGEEATRQCDVRIIAATNQDLRAEMEAGQFRQDLFYRLNVFPLEVAPLRRRKEDIPLLAAHLVGLAAAKFNVTLPRLTQANILQLQQYDWPGNVRELQNVVERGVITSRSGVLRFELSLDGSANLGPMSAGTAGSGDLPDVLPEAEIKRLERDNILAALRQTSWRIYGPDGAAERLGVKPTTLASRIKRLGLKRPR